MTDVARAADLAGSLVTEIGTGIGIGTATVIEAAARRAREEARAERRKKMTRRTMSTHPPQLQRSPRMKRGSPTQKKFHQLIDAFVLLEGVHIHQAVRFSGITFYSWARLFKLARSASSKVP